MFKTTTDDINFGTIDVGRDTPIHCNEDISILTNQIEERLKKETGLDIQYVSLINWRRFEDPE